jgi:hypothetical protein
LKIFTLPNQLLIIGKSSLAKDQFKPIQNIKDFVKPKGGLWTSPYTLNSQYYSAWHEWCSHEDFNSGLSKDSVVVELKENVRYFVIDSQQCLKDFIDIVGECESEFSKTTGYKFAVYPNWEIAATIFDVVYLTQKGAWDTHIPFENREYNLYGWDCETVLVLNYDCINKWEYKKLDILKEE